MCGRERWPRRESGAEHWPAAQPLAAAHTTCTSSMTCRHRVGSTGTRAAAQTTPPLHQDHSHSAGGPHLWGQDHTPSVAGGYWRTGRWCTAQITPAPSICTIHQQMWTSQCRVQRCDYSQCRVQRWDTVRVQGS